MQLKRVDPLSCAKVLGILYALVGLLFGGLFSLFALLGAAVGYSSIDGEAGGASPFVGLILGVGAVIIFPVFYGIMGAISAAVGAALYNFVARTVGGIEVELS